MKTKRYFTIKEVCELCDYHEYQVTEWIERGLLKSRIATKDDFGIWICLISRTDLYEFLCKQPTKKAARAKAKLLEMVQQEYIEVLDVMTTLMREGELVIRLNYLDWDANKEDPETLLYETEL